MWQGERAIIVHIFMLSTWHYRQRTIIFELIMHCIEDTDTDNNYFGNHFSLQMQMHADTVVLCSFAEAT